MPEHEAEGSLGEELEGIIQDPGQQPGAGGDADGTVFFANVWDFVYRWLRHMYKRPTGPNVSFRWDSDWFRCPEVVSRLTELWRVWEMARVDTGSMMAIWWRDYCDPAMDRIMSPEGPFRTSDEKTAPGQPLGCNRPPDGQFIDERTGGPFRVPDDDSLV